MENKSNNSPVVSTDVQIKEFLVLCLQRWYWIVASVVVVLSLGVIKILKTEPVYERTATILIKESERRRVSTEMEMMFSSGATAITSKLANEIVAFRSPELMKEVAKRLKLDVGYSVEGTMHNRSYYGIELPFEVVFLEETPVLCNFTVSLKGENGVVLSGISYTSNGSKVKSNVTVNGFYGDTLSTPCGRVVIKKQDLFSGQFTKPVQVSRTSRTSAVNRLLASFSTKEVDAKNRSDMLELTYRDVNISRAESILNTIINVYNENWVNDKNKMAVSTSEFIASRLESIESELNVVDEDISNYKSRNFIPDIESVSSMYMSEGTAMKRDIRELENQLYVAKVISSSLHSSSSLSTLIPMAASVSETGLAKQIDEYNELVLNRNLLIANSSEDNPVVKDVTLKLMSMRDVVTQIVVSRIKTLEGQITNMKSLEEANMSKIAQNPSQAKYLLSVGRQQKVKENLYIFLLQKREENELSRAFTAYNTRVITSPYGSSVPVAPQKHKILLIALLLGLFIPCGITFLQMSIDTKIRGRKDLEGLAIPFLGEIPLYIKDASRRHYSLRGIRKHSESDKAEIIVRAGSRNIVNESFRVLRANIEFMLKSETGNVILLTSFNPGSGKTFVSVNLGMVFAIKNKRVLVIDGDMRHASTSEVVGSPKCGLSDYLAGKVGNLDEVIVKNEKEPNLHFLPVGTIPPNPSELIGEAKFGEMIEKVKFEFDLVLIDTPPIDIVADTQVMAEYADRTIFIVRSGLLERSMLANISNLYDGNILKKMSLLLNGTDIRSTYYGHYSYYRGYGRYGKYGNYGKYSYYVHND